MISFSPIEWHASPGVYSIQLSVPQNFVIILTILSFHGSDFSRDGFLFGRSSGAPQEKFRRLFKNFDAGILLCLSDLLCAERFFFTLGGTDGFSLVAFKTSPAAAMWRQRDFQTSLFARATTTKKKNQVCRACDSHVVWSIGVDVFFFALARNLALLRLWAPQFVKPNRRIGRFLFHRCPFISTVCENYLSLLPFRRVLHVFIETKKKPTGRDVGKFCLFEIERKKRRLWLMPLLPFPRRSWFLLFQSTFFFADCLWAAYRVWPPGGPAGGPAGVCF